MSTVAKVKTGKEVVDALMTADTPAKKSKASKLQKEYIAHRASEGKDPKKVQAGLLSRVNRLTNEKAKPKAAPKTAAKATAAKATATAAAKAPAKPAAKAPAKAKSAPKKK